MAAWTATIAARPARLARWLAALTACLLLAACGGTSRPSPSPTSSLTPTATPTPQPLLVVLQPGSPDDVLRLVTLTGQEVTRTLVSRNVVIAGTTGDEVGFADQGRMEALRTDGQVIQLGKLPGWKGGRVVLNPNGKDWVWTTYNQESGTSVHAFLYLDESIVADADEPPGHWLDPVAWTSQGVVLEEAMLGLGGYLPYDLVTGPTLLVQPQQQTVGSAPKGRQLTTAACLYADLSGNGTVACRVPGGSVETTSVLQIQAPGGAPVSLPLPAGRFAAAGAISFRPTQNATDAPREAVVGGATLAGANTGGQGEVYETDLVNLQTRVLTPLSTPGLRPGAGSWAWISPTQVVCYRPAGAAGGAPGIFIAGGSGPLQQVTSSGTPVGMIDQGATSSPSPSPSSSLQPSPAPSGSGSPSPSANPL